MDATLRIQESKAPAELARRAEREREATGYPSAEVRPFVRELAARGRVTLDELAVGLNSYERIVLEPALEPLAFADVLEHCASNCRHRFVHVGPVPSSYDDHLAMLLAPQAAERIRLLAEKVKVLEAHVALLHREMDEESRRLGELSYAVEVRDDHDGGSVWYSEEEFIETREEAVELAAKFSRLRENEVARVVEVRRRVVAGWCGGQVTP